MRKALAVGMEDHLGKVGIKISPKYNREMKKQLTKGIKLGVAVGRVAQHGPKVAAGVGVVAVGTAVTRHMIMIRKYPTLAKKTKDLIIAAKQDGDYRKYYANKIKLARLSAKFGGSSSKVEKAKIRKYKALARESKLADVLVLY